MVEREETFPSDSSPQIRMRLLGACPYCQAEDAIIYVSSGEGSFPVECGKCQTLWPDSFNLIRENKGLIPVWLERQRYGGQEYGVYLNEPRGEKIPCRRMIVSILNQALITRFKLDVLFACEGGVCGTYQKRYIELRNAGDDLGLLVEQDYIQEEGLTEVLDFYEEMMGYLFEKPFQIGTKAYRRGEILRPSAVDPTTRRNEIWEILIAMLIKVKDSDFAKRAVGDLTKQASDSFAGPHLVGLSDEEIVKFFVPPPSL